MANKTAVKPETKVSRIPARCYLVYEEYMDWHLDHHTKPVLSKLEWMINRRRVLDSQES